MRAICEKLGRCPFGVFPSGECTVPTFADDHDSEWEDKVLDFWHTLMQARDREAHLADTEYLWRRPGSPTMKERSHD